VLLEYDCSDQWLLVEKFTGQPIGLSIASQLLQRSKIDKKFGIFFRNFDGKTMWERCRA
jgi:predicted Rdx family selenoprotein